jgi:hypothetical protein
MIVETLAHDSPEEALLKISAETKAAAHKLAQQLIRSVPEHSQIEKIKQQNDKSSSLESTIPLLEHQLKFQSRAKYYDGILESSLACSESILAAICKVATGGSQTSSELRELESQRRSADIEAQDIEAALLLRQYAAAASEALETRRYTDAANAIRDYRSVDASENAITLTGSHTVRAYDNVREVLQNDVLDQYATAVKNDDIGAISELTPLINVLQLSGKGVEMYLRFIKSLLMKAMNKTDDEKDNLGSKLSNVYNSAVTVLRHHLPMVSYLLGEADGDVALIQLVHTEVENQAIPIFDSFLKDKKLSSLHDGSNKFVRTVEERYTSGEDWEEERSAHETNMDDCGFHNLLGNLGEIDAFVEAMALKLQYTESYNRFLHHAVDEINKARVLRYKQRKEERRRKFISSLERDGREFSSDDERKFEAKEENLFKESIPKQVLAQNSHLVNVVTELGGYYSVLERALLFGTMQRAFHTSSLEESSYFVMTSAKDSSSIGSRALQTSLLEGSFFAAQRSTLRAFATGHTQAAAAATNFCSDAIGRILLEVMIRRCEASTSALKPGEGLLPGQGGIGQAALAVVTTAQKGLSKSSAILHEDKLSAKHKLEDAIARTCSSFNDLEATVDYVQKLEMKLLQEVETTFPQGHETEQLIMCIKSLGSVVDSFRSASDQCIGQLGNMILPRVRSIVTEIIGQESVTASSFSTVMSGTSLSSSFKLNYELDDLGYQLAQISEGFVSKL